MLKNEPTRQEKQFLKDQQEEIKEFLRQEKEREALKRRQQVKELYCMGIKTKLAKGPNPLSVQRKKKSRYDENGELLRKRRVRKGKRSKELCQQKRQKLNENGDALVTQNEEEKAKN